MCNIRTIPAKQLCGLFVFTLLLAGQSQASFLEETLQAVKSLEAQRGIVVLLAEQRDDLAPSLLSKTSVRLYVQFESYNEAAEARRKWYPSGMLGTRLTVGNGPHGEIGLADNLCDVLVSEVSLSGRILEEAKRVMRPEGILIHDGKTWKKPWPAGAGEWRHHYHGPDNNPQSEDTLASWPFLTQFISDPRYAPAPQASVTSKGVLYMALGHVAWHEREEPWLNTLVALNAFNGTELWRRPLRAGIMVDRCNLVATPEALYVADDQSCKVFAPRTGTLIDEIAVSAEQAGGTFWKWIALEDGVLYALIGPEETLDPTERWRRQRHGWPWNGISKGYNQKDYPWGKTGTLLAIDPETQKVLWRHEESIPVDSRGIAMKAGRLYAISFGAYLVCLDAKSGKALWRRTREQDPKIFEAIGPFRPGHGYVEGWKSTVYLKCSEKMLYIVGPQVEHLSALSAEDGRFLWKHEVKDLHIVLRPEGLYAIGPQRNDAVCHRLNPMTGEILDTFNVYRRACTRSTGSVDGIYFRAPGGSVKLDIATGAAQWISPIRPSCHIGVLVGNGHLYWIPWVCDCNLQMFGTIACAPAGKMDVCAQASGPERLVMEKRGKRITTSLTSAPETWSTYRADNARSATTKVRLPESVTVAWTVRPDHEEIPTAPVTAGGLVFWGTGSGVVKAVDAETGAIQWKTYTGGKIWGSPSVSQDRALVGSSDGWVYALEAATGRLLWRFRAAPQERRIPVYDRLLSTWPVTSGVLTSDGTAYFAAGIHNFDGTQVFALDIETGKIKWHNAQSGHLDRISRRGVAAQGDLLLNGKRLYLAGGNAVSPGVYDVETGKCLSPPPRAMGSHAPRGRELVYSKSQGAVVCGQPLHSPPDMPVYDDTVQWKPQVVQCANGTLTFAQGSEKGALQFSDPKERVVWSVPLPAPAVRWGIAVGSTGCVFLCLEDGTVICLS